MHLLYLDESGSVADPTQQFFVLAGVSVFERTCHWIEKDLDAIAARFDAANPRAVELHGSPMRGGKGEWRKFPVPDRVQAIKDALQTGICSRADTNIRLFGAVIRKAAVAGRDPVEIAFEQLCSRFDLFLRRRYSKHNDPQRGIMLFDKASTEQRIQTLARDFKATGHSWGKTMNYADVPVFLDSTASRLIQLADLVSFALYRFYEHKDNSLYDLIKHRFDQEGGVEHGLYVYL